MMAAVLTALVGCDGCKGKVEYRDNPETLAKLERCQAALGERENYTKVLEKRVADLEMGGSDEGTVVVELKGDLPEDAIINITGPGPHARAGGGPRPPRDPKGTAEDAELYAEFLAALRRSRPAITKCYQNELKKDARLQARTVTLNIQVDYRTSGVVQNASFNPRVSETFSRCMDAVARNWKLSAMPRAVSFNYRATLTPE